MRKLTQSLLSSLQSRSVRIGSFNLIFFCLDVLLSVWEWVYQSGRGELWHTRMSQELWFPLTRPRFISYQERFPLSSDWLRGLKQVSDRTGVESLTLPRLERNWLACTWVCSLKRTLCKTIQDRGGFDSHYHTG